MATAREKAIDRVRKLLNVASPSSGASPNERATAHERANDLITQHALDEYKPLPTARRQKKERSRPPRPAPVVEYDRWGTPITFVNPPPGGGWVPRHSQIDTTCGACGGTLYVGDRSYYNTKIGCYRHYRPECVTKPYGH